MRVVFGFPIYISLAFHCVRMNWLGRVIYTLAEFLFYILVCITLRWADKKSAFHTSCLHSHTSHTSSFYFTFSCFSYFLFYILVCITSRWANKESASHTLSAEVRKRGQGLHFFLFSLRKELQRSEDSFAKFCCRSVFQI